MVKKELNVEQTQNYFEELENIDTLAGLLLRFFRVYNKWFFNISRIMKWGAEQDQFTSLQQYTEGEIKEKLEDLLDIGLIKTKVSKKTKNILYKIS